METSDGKFSVTLRVFKGMDSADDFDMDRICDRLRYELKKRKISHMKAAEDLGVSRDLIFDYTNTDYPEGSMQVGTLKKFAEYLDKDKYYFCNEYHRFLDTVDVGNFLRKIRRKHNMTQKQFANYLGVSLARYKTYEEERCRLPLEVYDRLKNNINLTG